MIGKQNVQDICVQIAAPNSPLFVCLRNETLHLFVIHICTNKPFNSTIINILYGMWSHN